VKREATSPDWTSVGVGLEGGEDDAEELAVGLVKEEGDPKPEDEFPAVRDAGRGCRCDCHTDFISKYQR
jgi:hypothetical protein